MWYVVMFWEIVELVIWFWDKGVVGFDIVGVEVGYLLIWYLDVFEYMCDYNVCFMIYVGEVFGLLFIYEVIVFCGVDWLGYGVWIVDDIDVDVDGGF